MDFCQAEIARFKRSFEVVENGCWEWTRCILNNGYGYFYLPRGQKKATSAHRMSWRFHNNRDIPQGMCVCHTCDNRKCVNPDHLYLGTSSDNNTDTINRRRGNRVIGSQCSWAKLSDGDVTEILRSTDKQVVLAKRYGVDPSTISQIKSGRRRPNISGQMACR